MVNKNLQFVKMHALGNDFIIIDARESIAFTLPERCFLADRHLGIGCDQILLIENSQRANYFCRIYNTDGSEAEQCGNGLRALGWYLHHRMHTAAEMTIETLAGIFIVANTKANIVQLTLPTPDLEQILFPIQINAMPVEGVQINLGNPHAIFMLKSAEDKIISTIIKQLDKTHNLGFVEIIDRNTIKLKTHERGSGFTLACGSNAIAAAVAGISAGKLDRHVTIQLQYGNLHVTWPADTTPITLSGPVTFVFQGEVEIPG